MQKADSDVMILGAGLSGLTAGICLQKKGYSTRIIEKRSKAGGLCGTFKADGREFVIGCNEFGQSIQKYFHDMGIPFSFKAARDQFFFSFGNFTFPSGSAMLSLLRFVPDLIRLKKAGKKLKKKELAYTYLQELLLNHVKSDRFRDFICLWAYAMGTPPDMLRLSDISAILLRKDLDYGYNKMVIPVGGPGKMVEAMTSHYRQTGGTLELNCTIHTIQRKNRLFEIVLSNGRAAKVSHVITSAGRLSEYPERSYLNLSIGMLHLSLTKDFRYPENVHTISCLPKDIALWLKQLCSGIWPDEFGFHFFKSDLKTDGDDYPVNVYFYLPIGKEKMEVEQKKGVRDFILLHMDKLLPGISGSVSYEKMVDASDFRELHDGLSPAVPGKIVVGDFEKPSMFNDRDGIYYVGNTVAPPGEHACQAVLSGMKAAEMIYADSG